MGDPYTGEIRPFAFGFTPYQWLPCEGQAISKSTYMPLYMVIGDRYGSSPDQTKFVLPDLRACTPVGMGQGPNLTQWTIGNRVGSNSVTLTTSQIPNHSHEAAANAAQASNPNPSQLRTAGVKTGTPGNPFFYKEDSTGTTATAMNPNAVQVVGNGLPHENRQPYLTLNFCICTEGTYPVNPGAASGG